MTESEGLQTCMASRAQSFCSFLPEDTRRVLCSHSRQVTIKKGQGVELSGESETIVIVRSGAIASEMLTESGKPFLSFIGFAGDLGNVVRLVGSTRNFDAAYHDNFRGFALVNSSVCTVPFDIVNTLFDENPSFARLILGAVSDRCRMISEQYRHKIELDCQAQIVELFSLLERNGIDISDVTQDAISRVLGINRVTVTRLMSSAIKEARARSLEHAG